MYKIVGADQREYGPVTEEQVRQWVADGRANAQTIARFNDGPWKPLSTFPEFATLFPSGSLPGPAAPPLQQFGTPGAPVAPATNGLAIAGFVCSLLGLFCCGPVFATLGLVLSLVALSQINGNPSRYSGKGLAIAGVALALAGYALFALFLFTGVFRRAFRRFPRHF